ncbi:hypothetical protein FAY30_10905 [Bacillus sp. S3]|uniref:flagellar filament capping protein FliD n=1 Tax=Bacillus sp. S3 TaxID=486398 RepID=UPI001188BFD8|nr:flagellar filament capping protein FliD [Bacillus sp. S3]QCJ42376.1 hypothetical protein FAY30_10905 [Bacillus sp. S3]
MVSVNLTTHISGLASGMDTEKMVSDMMRVNRIPLDKLMQSKTLNTWRTDAYREINTKIASFRSAMEDLRLEGTFTSAQKVTSNNSSIDVSMAGKASLAGFTITAAKMATPPTGSSVSFNTGIKSGSDSIFIDENSASDISFFVNEKKITIPKESKTFDKAIAEMNSQLAEKNIKVANVGGSLVFTTTDTGADKSITIEGFDNTTSSLNLTNGTTSNGSNGEKGFVTINGTTIEISSNNFTYDNVKINLREDIINGNGQAVVSVVPDTDKLFDKIKTFVDKYNELIKDLNDKISEPVNRKFPPLTDEQRKAMKEDEIKQWEEKAKIGLISNDPTVRQFLTQIRTSINEAVQGVTGAVGSLKDIGITTSSNYRENGKLTLDESKLKSMLSTNLPDIQKLFAAKDTTDSSKNTITSTEKYAKSGLAVRVYDRIGDVLDKLKVIAGAPGTVSINSSLAKEAASIDKNVAKVQDRLNSKEQNLWKKFNAMEEALQRLNSQSSWLYQQLGQ